MKITEDIIPRNVVKMQRCRKKKDREAKISDGLMNWITTFYRLFAMRNWRMIAHEGNGTVRGRFL